MAASDHILVAELAGALLVVPGIVFDKVCSQCGARVMVAPSGQTFLKKHTQTQIICIDCFERRKASPKDLLIPAAPAEQILGEVASAKPNTWRERN